MAVTYENTGETIRIVQTRRGMRITFAVIIAIAIASAALFYAMNRVALPTALSCTHATGRCSLTVGRSTTDLDVATIRPAVVGSSTDGSAHWVWFSANRSRELCGATDPSGLEAATAFANELNAFLASNDHPAIALHCETRKVNGPSPKILGIALLGWLLIAWMFSPYSHEVTATIDRREGIIASKGRAWLKRSWDVRRPLADVARIEMRSWYVGYGNRRYVVFAVFRDGSEVLLWSPAAVTIATLNERLEEMRVVAESPRAANAS